MASLDPRTGSPLCLNDRSGHLDPILRKGVSCQGIMTAACGCLFLAGGNVISPGIYGLATGRCLSRDVGNSSPRADRGEEAGIVAGKYSLLGGRLRFSTVRNYVNPERFTLAETTETGHGPWVTFCQG